MTDVQEIHIHIHLDALAELATQVISIKELVMTEADAINALAAKFDALNASVDAFGAEVGDANADGTVA